MTTFTGSAPASEVVNVPAAASLQWHAQGSSSVTYSGNGRVLGFNLRRTDGSFGFTAAQFNGCDTAGCTPRPIGYIGSAPLFPQMMGGDLTASPQAIPAGDYVLTFWADGAPASITLTLQGLTGTASIAPSGPADVSITTPAVTLAASASGEVQSGGTTLQVTDTSTGAFVWANLILWGTGAAAGEAGGCTYEGSPPPAYLPGCPGYASQETETFDEPMETGQWGASFGFGSGFPAADTYGAGLWNASGTDVSGASRVILFVQPLPAGAVPPASSQSPPPTFGAEGASVGDPSTNFGGAHLSGPAGSGVDVGAIDYTAQPPGLIVSS